MKTTVVPAQITTVEDRIAGNLTFTQIIMMVIPLITGTALYVLLPPRSHFNVFKLILIGIQFAIFGIMAIRFRGKILIEWLVILMRFKLRPRIYIFTKNDSCGRVSTNVNIVEEKTITENTKEPLKKAILNNLSIYDQSKIDKLFDNPSLTFRFGLRKKGGIDVSVVSAED